MAFGNAELDKLKGVERAEHALNHSDLDRPKHYFYDPEVSKSAFEKQEEERSIGVSGKINITKILEVVGDVIVVGILLMFFGGDFWMAVLRSDSNKIEDIIKIVLRHNFLFENRK